MIKNWQLIDLFYLLYLEKYKPHHIINFVNKFDSYSSLTDAIGRTNLEFEADYREHINLKINQILEVCENNNYKIISFWDENYPILLRNISSPPLILYVKGDYNFNYEKLIAVVGTRHNTFYGKMVAERFARELVENGVDIVSGLATGIDSITHKEVLKHNGHTIAVVASGLNKISPTAAQKLANEIIEHGGAVISEYPPDESAQIGYFPQRNRIISGISSATLVVESSVKGGSLITARFAFDQGREVFAIPGNINYEHSVGCNNLIKSNIASLCLSPEDILENLGWQNYKLYNVNKEIQFNSEIERNIYESLGFDPVSLDTLLDKLDIDISTILVNLLNLELTGLIKQLPGKQYIRI